MKSTSAVDRSGYLWSFHCFSEVKFYWSAVCIGGDFSVGHPETALLSIAGSGHHEGTVSFI
ncbi:MAG: hypothetical protein VXZ38_04950 [Planctomycetota bacterium]|nr:hypothetical protein [Planctomycetota bacterium]